MPEIEFVIRRHGAKAKGGESFGGRTLVKDELAPVGYEQAKRAGARYAREPPSIALRRVTNLIRTSQTSGAVVEGAKAAGAMATFGSAKEDAHFFGVTVADKEKWAKAAAKGEDEGLRAFLRGGDVGFTENPRQLAERYLTGVHKLHDKFIRHLARKPESGYRAGKYVVDISAHAPGVGALAAYLMGQHSPDGSVKLATASLLKVPERLTEEVRVKVQLDNKGRVENATAHFRGRKKDVTKLFASLPRPKLRKEDFGPGGWYSPSGA